MSAPPLMPQIMQMFRVNRKAIWKNLAAAHISTAFVLYAVYKIPVSEEAKRASKTLNPWQDSGH